MAFIARVEKPCTHCGVVIPKGTGDGFTWDRSKGGFIHTACIKLRKEGTPVTFTTLPLPVPVPVDPAFNDYKHPHKHGTDGLPLPPEVCVYCLTHETNGHKKGCLVLDKTAEIQKDNKAAREDMEKRYGLDSGKAVALVQLIQSLAGQRGIDETEVRRIAADEASKVSNNRSIAIKVGDAPEIKLDLAHRDLPILVKIASSFGVRGHRPNVYMHGPAGSGKSSAARQVSEVLKLTYGYISLNPQTPDSRLLGYMHAGGEYVPSEFFRRYTEGGVFCIDEIDNAAASLVTTLNGLLENGHGAFPHGVFSRHKDFVCICTANTIGRGGDVNYPERRALDGAFLERFVFMSWEYDDDLTKAIVTGILDKDAPEFMAWVKQEARELQARYPTLIVSPRAHIQGATLEKMGMSRNQIRSMVIARGLR